MQKKVLVTVIALLSLVVVFLFWQIYQQSYILNPQYSENMSMIRNQNKIKDFYNQFNSKQLPEFYQEKPNLEYRENLYIIIPYSAIENNRITDWSQVRFMVMPYRMMMKMPMMNFFLNSSSNFLNKNDEPISYSYDIDIKRKNKNNIITPKSFNNTSVSYSKSVRTTYMLPNKVLYSISDNDLPYIIGLPYTQGLQQIIMEQQTEIANRLLQLEGQVN